jgi:uncharacterized protein YycO
MRFILVHGTSFVSQLIEWQSGRGRHPYSHAALLFTDNTVIESRERHYSTRLGKCTSGVQKLSLSQWQADNAGTSFDIFKLIVPCDETKIRLFAERQVGKPYDYWGVLRFLTRRNYQQQPDDKWWCSEIVFQAILKSVALLENTEGWEVAPDWLKRTPLAFKMA